MQLGTRECNSQGYDPQATCVRMLLPSDTLQWACCVSFTNYSWPHDSGYHPSAPHSFTGEETGIVQLRALRRVTATVVQPVSSPCVLSYPAAYCVTSTMRQERPLLEVGRRCFLGKTGLVSALRDGSRFKSQRRRKDGFLER